MLRLLTLLCCLATVAPAADLDPQRIAATAETILAIGDRSAGSPGAEAAVALIEGRLADLGLGSQRVRTTVAISRNRGAALTVGGTTYPLFPHRRNRAAVATTGGEDLTGPLVLLGKGGPEALAGRDLHGAIAILDADSGRAWIEVAQLGARAVIFRGSQALDGWNLAAQGLPASLDFPRFVADGLDGLSDGTEATLRADVVLEPATAWTVVARLPGSGKHTEAVLLSTGYESPATIPGLTPGATPAWNTALLLELAAVLAAEPPVRDTILVFHGGAHEHLRGLRQTVAALSLDRAASGYAANSQVDELHRNQSLKAWRGAALAATFADAAAKDALTMADLRDGIRGKLAEPPIDGIGMDDQKALAVRSVDAFIALLSGRRADDILPRLERARLDFSPAKRKTMTEEEIAGARASIAAIDAEYQTYRTIQQKLDYEKDLNGSESAVLPELVQEGRVELERHLAIVDRYRDDYASLAKARDILAGATPIHLIGLDLTDGNARFAAAVKGTYVTWIEELGWLTSGLVKLVDDLNKQNGETLIPFARAAHDAQDEVDAWFGANPIHDAGVAGIYLPASTLRTVADGRYRLGTPQDDDAHFDRALFGRQLPGLATFIQAYIDAPFIANRKPKNIGSKTPKVETEVRSTGSKTGFRGFPYALVFTHRDKARDLVDGIGLEESYWADAFGICNVPFVPERHPALAGGTPLSVYGLGTDGRIAAALATAGTMKSKGDVAFPKDKVTDVLTLVFRCERSHLFGVFDPRLLIPLSSVHVLSATRDSAPNFYHSEAASSVGAVAIFSEPGIPLRLTATQGQVGNRLIITGHAANQRHGTGEAIGLPSGNLSTMTEIDSAEDTFRLNDQRLALLRKNGINPDSLVNLHSLTERHLESARQALEDRQYEQARGEAQTAWALAGRVYPNVLSTANDVVYGLVIMLLFAIPFAWICERLFVSGATIVRKVAGFIAFFVVIFLFFYFFHPAFELATTPMVIFLAFVILIMSAWVIGMLYNRFEFEMEQIRMSGLGMHKADVSRLGTLIATVGLGISNMRRRPIRTFLTALTVVLMTFILLTFASFNPAVGSQRLGVDAAPPYTGILVRQSGWLDLPDLAESRISRATSDRFDLHRVRWLAPGATQPKFPVVGPSDLADVAGVVGVEAGDPTGIEQALIRSDAGTDGKPELGLGDGSWIFLPREVLKRIGADLGDEVRIRGVPLKAGAIDPARLSSLTQIGGDPLTPLSYDPTDRSRQDENARLAALAGDGGPTEENSSAVHLSPAAIGVVSEAALRRMDGGLRGLMLTPKDRSVDVAAEAEELARQLAVTLRVGTAGESYLLTSVGRMSVAGLGAVLIPLILGGLIIFSTMLNSVAERGKEIFIFSSLGLAPIHVAALFLVEASIYAVLGGLGGYMLAQLIISGLGLAADLGWGVRPDINYSSFTAVATILLVMATVLFSALYPALIASKAANPGTMDFRVPDPEGDHLDIAFPFTVASRDVRGLCAFLARYFDTNTEAAGGCFTAAEARMLSDDGTFGVSAKIWLAPFDLGISQTFRMTCKPTDVKAIYSVHLSLDLLSGQRSAWKRTNLAFLKDLRQQFLVWRTLSPETMDQYRADGGDEQAKARLAAGTHASASNRAPVAGGAA